MINEQQANKLLSQCEIWLEANLTRLRDSLRSNHENTRPMLWELIVLHSIASFIALKHDESVNRDKNISSQIQHEPVDGSPDILLQPDFCQPFNIEITYINAQEKEEQDLRNFCRRVRTELSERGVKIQSLKVRFDPANHQKIIQAPSNNRWRHYFRSTSWNSFVTKILADDLPLNWDIDEGNIIVKAAKQGQEFMTYPQYPQIPMTDSPVYKAIEQKARQAKKWTESGKEYQPLVLIIGASEILTQTNSLGILSHDKIIEAINTALSETSGFGFGDRNNRLRVSNSKLISAVVFVGIISSGLTSSFHRRASKPLIIENPYPSLSLTFEQRYLLEQIDFNQVEYGSNLEHWDQITGDIESVNLNKYTQGLEQRFVVALENFNYDLQHPFSVEIPCDPFACLLTGLINNINFWGDNDSCEIKTYIDNAIVVTHPIVNIELVNADSRYSQGSRIKIDFAPACFARIRKISVAKDSQYYLNNNSDGTISVAIDVDFILSILTSTKNVEELWISEGQEELYKSLKGMVENRQKIIGLSLVQDSLNSNIKAYIIFMFGAATNTLIREDKSVLNEEKKLKKLRRSSSKEN